MNDEDIFRIVYRVGFDAERRAGHGVQTVRSHKPTTENKRDALNAALFICLRQTV